MKTKTVAVKVVGKTRKGNPKVDVVVEKTPQQKLIEAKILAGQSASAARKALRDPALVAELELKYPLGTVVTYTGGRVPGRQGESGPVVGYRDGNGLWVDFPSGRGSITPGKAMVVEPVKAVAGKGGKKGGGKK